MRKRWTKGGEEIAEKKEDTKKRPKEGWGGTKGESPKMGRGDLEDFGKGQKGGQFLDFSIPKISMKMKVPISRPGFE